MPMAQAGIRFIALTYFVLLQASVHTSDGLRNWLHASNFGNVSESTFRMAPGVTLVEATKQ